MGVSTRYHGKGLVYGCATFRGKHNKARFLTLLVLFNIELHYRHIYSKGVPVFELARISGVLESTLLRHLGDWCRWGFVNRVQRFSGYWTNRGYRIGAGGVLCFHYTIAARGRRWVREYQELVPIEWYAHLGG